MVLDDENFHLRLRLQVRQVFANAPLLPVVPTTRAPRSARLGLGLQSLRGHRLEESCALDALVPEAHPLGLSLLEEVIGGGMTPRPVASGRHRRGRRQSARRY